MNTKFAQCFKRLTGITLGALLILPIFSGRAFANHETFGKARDWTGGPYYGTRRTFFADVTGDGTADAIAVNNNTVTVRRSDGCRFGPNEDWTRGSYYGNRGNFFADVTGDGRADAIVVNNNVVTVRRSNGLRFGPNEDWTRGSYINLLGWNFFADVTGDGRADFIRNTGTITVRRSVVLPDGRFGFGPEEDWSRGRYGGSLGTFFADVTGDGTADAIAVEYNTVTVRAAYVISDRFYGFNSPRDWTQGPYYGARGTFFADVTGDGTADAIAVNYDKISVRKSDGWSFVARTVSWTQEPYYGSLGTFFADVTGDGTADAIVVNGDTVTVRRSMFNRSLADAQELRCYGD